MMMNIFFRTYFSLVKTKVKLCIEKKFMLRYGDKFDDFLILYDAALPPPPRRNQTYRFAVISGSSSTSSHPNSPNPLLQVFPPL